MSDVKQRIEQLHREVGDHIESRADHFFELVRAIESLLVEKKATTYEVLGLTAFFMDTLSKQDKTDASVEYNLALALLAFRKGMPVVDLMPAAPNPKDIH